MEKRRQRKVERRESTRSLKEKGIIFGAYAFFALMALLSGGQYKQNVAWIFSQIFLILGLIGL